MGIRTNRVAADFGSSVDQRDDLEGQMDSYPRFFPALPLGMHVGFQNAEEHYGPFYIFSRESLKWDQTLLTL